MSNASGVRILSLSFFLLFTGFLTTQNLLPLLLAEQGLGQLGSRSLTVLYGVFGVSCAAVPPFLKQCVPRLVIPFAALTYVAYCLSAGVAASGFGGPFAGIGLLVASVIVGLGAAVVWPCQGYILTHYSPSDSVNKNVSMFQTCWTLSVVLGPVIAQPVLAHGGSTGLFVSMAALTLGGASLLMILPQPTACEGVPIEPPVTVQPRTDLVEQVRAAVVRPLLLLSEDTRAARIAVLSLAHGAGLNAFVATTLPQLAVLTNGLLSESAHAAVAKAQTYVGIGRLVAAASYALVADRFGRRAVLLSVSLCLLLTAVFCYAHMLVVTLRSAVPLVPAASLLLGAANGWCRSVLVALISTIYKDDAIKGFALMQLCTSLGSSTAFVYLSWLTPESAVMIVVAGYACAAGLSACHAPLFCTAVKSD